RRRRNVQRFQRVFTGPACQQVARVAQRSPRFGLAGNFSLRYGRRPGEFGTACCAIDTLIVRRGHRGDFGLTLLTPHPCSAGKERRGGTWDVIELWPEREGPPTGWRALSSGRETTQERFSGAETSDSSGWADAIGRVRVVVETLASSATVGRRNSVRHLPQFTHASALRPFFQPLVRCRATR